MNSKAIAAMSGGVDSSVAAALLCEQGFSVTGITMHLYSCHREKDRSCCSARDRMDARAVCERLGIGLEVVDLRECFQRSVVEPFVDEYLAGRTPSPCVRCNEYIKFPALMAEAVRNGADAFATGHYARVVRDGDIVRLLKARDDEKDQSYFLFCLTQDILARLRLPLGEMTKEEVRSSARAKGLPVHEKAESQEICFVTDDDYASFVDCRASDRLGGPGDFVDREGMRLGRHRGIHAYTVGQRRGLGMGGGPRRYVVGIDRGANTVTLGADEDLMRDRMSVESASWIHPSFARSRDVTVKIRAVHAGKYARIRPLDGGRVDVEFTRPVRAIAPGQAAVFYDGDEVIGGGWIE
jgi:tRNA-specific 2-thiouridylase